MNKLLPTLSQKDVNIVQRNTVYHGFFKMEKVQLRHRLYHGGWSEDITRELFVRGTAVAAVIYDPQNHTIGLVEQFRVGALQNTTGPWLYEVVAGMTEAGETPASVIERELQEEANITDAELIYICDYFTSPGGTDESLSLYCALADLSEAGGIYGLPEEGEDIRMMVLPADEVFAQLYTGSFNNAATLICLQWLQMNYTELTKGKTRD